MNHSRQTSIAALVAAVLIAGAAGASEIYKWTDENGNVIYGDRPDGAAEQVAISSRSTDPERVAAQQERYQAMRTASAERAEARDEADKSREELRAEREQREQQCTQARAELQKLLQSRRIYKLDDSGERDYYDDAGMQEVRARAQERVEEYCTG